MQKFLTAGREDHLMTAPLLLQPLGQRESNRPAPQHFEYLIHIVNSDKTFESRSGAAKENLRMRGGNEDSLSETASRVYKMSIKARI
ncbi:hypothetical protein J437_LFUL005629 [Ladona fulva]|uniref:Uncharacterized protein n=1 Tax=Ladona fulva TaxID=123851 RepID=A0A8K0K1C6_LADFU|nr:hypothetical protein J437_LFUL005629 [Ladona fulva]